jgi:hypothetical protein
MDWHTNSVSNLPLHAESEKNTKRLGKEQAQPVEQVDFCRRGIIPSSASQTSNVRNMHGTAAAAAEFDCAMKASFGDNAYSAFEAWLRAMVGHTPTMSCDVPSLSNKYTHNVL